jgi:hypothetical protein
MKPSLQDLIAKSYDLFPRGIERRDPRYAETPEVRRQKAARIPASARYNDWRSMVRRLRAQFPENIFPGVEIHNECLFLQSPTAGADNDRCYTGGLSLPSRSPEETHHRLDFLVSFVVPYYILRSSHMVDEPETPELPPGLRPRTIFIGDTCYALPPDPNAVEDEPRQKRRLKRQVESFTLSPDEEPFAKAISEEIETTFPGYEPIPPEVGLTVIPDVQAGGKWFGEATIFTCLFSDNW